MPNTVRRLAGVLHLNQDTSVPKSNRIAFPSVNTATTSTPLEVQYQQRPQQNTDFNHFPTNSNGFTQSENQSPPHIDRNFNNQNGSYSPNQWPLNSGNGPNTQLNPVNSASYNHHQSFLNSQNTNATNDDRNDKPPVWSDDTESDKLEDKNGHVDKPQETAEGVMEASTSMPGLLALTPVPSERSSGLSFANFRKYHFDT